MLRKMCNCQRKICEIAFIKMVTPASEFYPDTQSLKQATYHDCLRGEETETEMDYISGE